MDSPIIIPVFGFTSQILPVIAGLELVNLIHLIPEVFKASVTAATPPKLDGILPAIALVIPSFKYICVPI